MNLTRLFSSNTNLLAHLFPARVLFLLVTMALARTGAEGVRASQARRPARARIVLGNLYGLEQRPTLAEQEYLRALEIDPKNAAVQIALARIYMQGRRS